MPDENELTTVDDDPDALDASQDDHLAEQSDNSGEVEEVEVTQVDIAFDDDEPLEEADPADGE